MTTTYSTPLRLAIQETGDNANTWGDILNDNTIELIEQAIAETSSIDLTVGTGSYTLTTANGNADEARRAILRFFGAPSVNRTVIIPSVSKVYVAYNAVSSSKTVTVSTGSGATVTIQPGKALVLYCDSSAVYSANTNDVLLASNNLSDLQSIADALTNLGLSCFNSLTANKVLTTNDTSAAGFVTPTDPVYVSNGAVRVHDASETQKGVTRFATSAEVSAGTLDNVAISPANLSFSSSLGASGYYELPGGLLFQWGKLSGVNGNIHTVTFPQAFTTPYGVTVSKKVIVNASGAERSPAIFTLTTTDFSVQPSYSGAGASTFDVWWFAWGQK